MRLDQTLHGYKDGHRLLRASRELPASTHRQMALLSDMSGSTLVRGFEEYLTGYPLPEIGVYAIARTWYAPEMRRPGCVWTHTLLCSFADLQQIVDGEPGGRDGAAQVSWPRLARLFRRPMEGSGCCHIPA